MLDANTPKYLAIVFVVVIAIIDYRTRKLPNLLTGPAALFGLVMNFYLGGITQFLLALGGAVIGVIIIVLPQFLTQKKYKNPLGGGDAKLLGAPGAIHENPLGSGDAKLLGALGAILLPAGILQAAFYFCLIYGAFGVVAIIRRRQHPGSEPSTIALGPLIAAGTVLSILLERQTRLFFGF
jgi:prepilin signal peptidase PulO-like enzyme (type II secretory pathway)